MTVSLICIVSVRRSVRRARVRFVRVIRSVRLDERVSIVDGETHVDVRGAAAHTHSRASSSVAPSHRRRCVSRSIASIVHRSMQSFDAIDRCHRMSSIDDIDRSIELEIAIEIRESAIRCVCSCVWVNSETEILALERKSTSTRRKSKTNRRGKGKSTKGGVLGPWRMGAMCCRWSVAHSQRR